MVQLTSAGSEIDPRQIRALAAATDSVTVQATDLDIRNLSYSQDNVEIRDIQGRSLFFAPIGIDTFGMSVGVFDSYGNRMPTMDAVGRRGYVSITDGTYTMPTMDSYTRPGYVDVIDRSARVLGSVNQGDSWDLSYSILMLTNKVDEIDFTWNADGTLATKVFKKGANTVLTLTYTWNADGTLNKIVRT
jgi:hypothetical protein